MSAPNMVNPAPKSDDHEPRTVGGEDATGDSPTEKPDKGFESRVVAASNAEKTGVQTR